VSTESEDLWRYIHGIVNERVPVEHRATVTDLVAKTTVHILTTPEFLFGLRVVQELQAENEQLRRAVVSLQTAYMPAPRARPRKATAKKATAKKATAPKKAAAKRPAAKRSNTRAFKQGRAGR